MAARAVNRAAASALVGCVLLASTAVATSGVRQGTTTLPVRVAPVRKRDPKRPDVAIPADKFRWHRATVTAYTAGPASTGKTPGDPGYDITFSGLPARIGTVAVDLRIIPLGSIVYVPHYGLAVALDTGSAIRGWHVDVFLPPQQKALRWGRRNLTIGVLRASPH